MKRLDLTRELKDVSGFPVPLSPTDPTPSTVGKILALMLQNSRGSKLDPLKAWNMALTCYSKDYLDMDKTDFMALRETIEAESQPVLIKGQLAEAFAEAKETE